MTYSTEVLADSPVAYWRLGESSGTVAGDEVAALDGTYVGSPTLGSAGALKGDPNTAVTLDGVNDGVSAPVSASLAPTSGLTVEAWARRTGANGNAHSAVARCVSGSTGYEIVVRESDGQVWWAISAGSYFAINLTGFVLDADWHHLVLAYDSAAGGGLYADGALVDSIAADGAISYSATPQLGFGYAPDAPGFWLKGAVDEGAVYNYALSAARISEHYQEALAGLTLAGTLPALTEAITLRSYTRTLIDNQAGAILIRGASIEPVNAPDVEPVPATVSEAEMRDKAVAYTLPTMVNGRPT